MYMIYIHRKFDVSCSII